jgi:L-fuconate dehydratase
MAVGAVLTALWDLVAKYEGKPLWEVLSDMSPEETVSLVDFRYIRDVLTPAEALEILKRAEGTKAERKAKLLQSGIPAYTTSPGWLGYSDEKMVRLAKEAVADGFTLIKLKCGGSIADDKRRLKLAREAVGPNVRLAIDANQVWSVDEAIAWLNELRDKSVDLYWIEEPTSPDDALGHATIAKAIAPIRVATGEHVQNRIIFKQMLQLGAFSFMQIDSTRVAGPNENIANILMAAKFGIPVCPHAGGVGLCELVQHLSMFDYVAVSGENDARVIEFVDHLHEHFVSPVKIERGRYLAPTAPGAGGEMFPESIKRFTFPTGEEWQ